MSNYVRQVSAPVAQGGLARPFSSPLSFATAALTCLWLWRRYVLKDKKPWG